MKTDKITVAFKSVEVKDANDKPIPAMKTVKDEKTGVETVVPELDKNGKPVMQRTQKPAIVVETNVFDSIEDLVAILSIEDVEKRDKQVKLVLNAMNDVIDGQIRALVKEDEAAVREKGIPPESLTWEFLANMPEKERKGAAIPDEVWKTFEDDYVSVIVHHGVPLENAKMGAKLMVQRFYPVKYNKNVVAALQKRLAVWYAHSEQASTPEMQSVYELLQTRAETLLKQGEETLLAAV